VREACPVCRKPFKEDPELGLIRNCDCGVQAASPYSDSQRRAERAYRQRKKEGKEMPRSIEKLCRAERRRAQNVFDRHVARVAEHPDKAEEPADSDELPIERSFEQDGLDTEPIL
jgi:hypothetical protein